MLAKERNFPAAKIFLQLALALAFEPYTLNLK